MVSPPVRTVLIPALSHEAVTASDEKYPRAGSGVATKAGLKAWLDPKHSYTRPSGPAKYCRADDLSTCFEDKAGTTVEVNPLWQAQHAGEYVVFPLGNADITFRWW
jgi:hypothetical protein